MIIRAGTATAASSTSPFTLGGPISQIIGGATSVSIRNNANNADNFIVTDAGLATVRNMLSSVFTNVDSGVGNISGIQSVLTINPGGAYTGQRQAYWGLLTLTGSGALHTSVQTACAELWTRNSTTGGLTTTVYALEGTFDNQSADSVTSAYAIQANWRNLGGGNVTTAIGVRSVFNPGAAGTVTSLNLFYGAMDESAGTAPITVANCFNSGLLHASGGGTDTAGGYTVRGALLPIPVQGGNTSGTVLNAGLVVSAGGGSPAGGTVNSYGVYVQVPNAASGTGNQNNYAVRIQGAGTTVVAGVANYALYSDATVASLFAGPLQVGSSTSFASTSSQTLNIVANGTHSSGTSQIWDGVKVAGTYTLTGTTHITLATGVNMVTLAQPTITDGSAVTVDLSATLAILGAPVGAGAGPATITNAYAFWVQAGLSRFDAPITNSHVTTAAINSTNTATATQVATGYITSTSAAPTTITLPTGTNLGPVLGAAQGTTFDLFIDNTGGASTVTIAVNGATAALSSAAVAVGASFGLLTVASGVTGVACFRLMFLNATNYVFTRIS